MRSFLEIGTADYDTLSDRFAGRSNWRGVSVEAVPEYFQRVRQHAGNSYVNAVCTVEAGDAVPFHYIPPQAVEMNQFPQAVRGCGSTSINDHPFLLEHPALVRTVTLPRITVSTLLESPVFRDQLTGRRRVDLLKLDASPCNRVLLEAVLAVVCPTNVIFSTISMADRDLLEIDERLAELGYEYRGRRAERVRYARPSIVLVANMKWSTGSIARDLASIPGRWDVDCLGWDVYPRDLELLLNEYDAAASFTLPTPVLWPALQRGGVMCCGPVEIDWANHGHPSADHPAAKAAFGFQGRCIGAVSRELYAMLLRQQHQRRVFYTPASVRLARFQRREPRPLRVLGWIGDPNGSKAFGMDAKRFSLFCDIVSTTGLKALVTHRDYVYETMQSFYDQIDLLVCTSVSEGGPLGPFEAIACGVPVISTDVGLVREVASIPKFGDLDGAVSLIKSFQTNVDGIEASRTAQYLEVESRWSMERLLPLWERFFHACRTPNPSELAI